MSNVNSIIGNPSFIFEKEKLDDYYKHVRHYFS